MRLDGGFTTNRVIKTGNKVKKFCSTETSVCEITWYGSVPESYRPGGLRMPTSDFFHEMDYIESVGIVDLDVVFGMVETYKHFTRLNEHEWPVYIDRIKHHLSKSPISNGEKLIEKLESIELQPTFAHGDLSIRNIIQSSTGPKLIDPLYFDNFGSYLLDYAKLAFSLKFYNEDLEGFEKVKRHANVPFFDILVASECVRVATYSRKFDFVAENLINELP